MAHQGALTATTAPHDDKDITVIDGKGQIPLHHKTPISHRQVFDDDVGFIFSFSY
jgi:hypothetical protein